MIIYATHIPMKKEFDRESFLSSIVKWNAQGKYRISGLETQIHLKNFEITDGDNSIYSITMEDELTTAVRVHNANKGGIWDTDLILNEDKNTLTVCVDRSVEDTTELMKGFAQVPRIIGQLIADGFTGDNLCFPLSDAAIQLNAEHQIELKAAISGEISFALPIVYLSSRSKLDADKLAGKLTGLATVVLDREDTLKESYPEAIYVFFPHKKMKPRSFGDYPLHREIALEIVSFLNQQTYSGLDSWNGVNNAFLDAEAKKNALKYQNAASENEALSELQEEFLKQEQINKAERERNLAEISRLQYENHNLFRRIEKAESGAQPILHMGAEKDYYKGEHLEIVIEILRDYLEKSVGADSTTRRHDVLQSILDANPAEGTPEKFRKLIKNAFEGYTDFTSKKIQDALRETGIEVVNHSGHYKIAYHGDTRYTYEAAATSSDSFRAGKNCSAGINKLMF